MTRRYPAYKDSGVEWLGEVPEGWALVCLKHACHVFPSNVDKHTIEGELPVLLCNYTDVYYNEVIAPNLDFMAATATPEEIEKFTLKVGDVVFTKDSETADDIGIAALIDQALPGVICGYHLSIARPYPNTHGPFIKRFFDSMSAKAYFQVSANGLTRVGLGQYALDNLPVALPPLPEQTIIAAFLDRETAKIDALVAEQRRLIDLLREKRQAVISHAVTKGLNSGAPLKPSGIDWLGDVPVGWEVVPLKRVTLERCDGPFGSGLKSEHYVDAGMRVVRLQNIKADGFSDGDAAFIDLDYASSELSRHEVLAGDVLIAGLGDERNLVGRACVAPVGIEPAMVKADCFRFRLDTSRAVSVFVALQLNTSAAFDAGTKATGTTRSRIPLSQMAERAIALPPSAEQQEIAEYVERVSKGFDTLTATAETAITLLQERRAALISAAVTGKIDVRHLSPAATEAA